MFACFSPKGCDNTANIGKATPGAAFSFARLPGTSTFLG
jgi:hypothetical protein